MTGSSKSLAALLQRSALDDHEEILEAANNALKESKHDVRAQRVRLIALLQLDRYEDALRVLREGGVGLQDAARLECAYALYKAGSWEEAEQLAAGGTQRGLEHLYAQLLYRAERFELAAKTYDELAHRAPFRHEISDLQINRAAIDAQLHWAGQGNLWPKKKLNREDLEQFEMTYNAACGYLAKGELKQAALLLSRAKDLCNAAEELSDAEKASETLPIRVQQLYVLCRMGKTEEAERLASSLDISSITDTSTRQIAQNNSLIVSSRSQNPYLAHRTFHSATQTSGKDLPFSFQSTILEQNSAALDLMAGKYVGVVRATSLLLANRSPPSTTTSNTTVLASILNTAAHIRTTTGKAALRQVLALLEQKPKDIGVVLVAIQLYLASGNLNAATDLLSAFFVRLDDSLEDVDQQTRFTPGLVALLVSLYSKQNRTTEIKAQLRRAADYWKQSSLLVQGNTELFQTAGRELLSSPSSEELRSAHEIFSTILSRDADNLAAIAGFVASMDDLEATSSERLAKKLPSVDKLISTIDVDALEMAGVVKMPVVLDANKKRAADGDVRPRKAKKTRTSRLPKDYDPGKTADPERWLPLRDRSNYRPKGKKKAKAVSAATQGGAVSEESRPATPSAIHQAKPSAVKKRKGKSGK